VFAPLLRAQSISEGAIGVERADSCSPNWAHPATAKVNPRIIAVGNAVDFMRGFPPLAAG
jgi:hypothetical protein